MTAPPPPHHRPHRQLPPSSNLLLSQSAVALDHPSTSPLLLRFRCTTPHPSSLSIARLRLAGPDSPAPSPLRLPGGRRGVGRRRLGDGEEIEKGDEEEEQWVGPTPHVNVVAARRLARSSLGSFTELDVFDWMAAAGVLADGGAYRRSLRDDAGAGNGDDDLVGLGNGEGKSGEIEGEGMEAQQLARNGARRLQGLSLVTTRSEDGSRETTGSRERR